jgi:hypothetical protein
MGHALRRLASGVGGAAAEPLAQDAYPAVPPAFHTAPHSTAAGRLAVAPCTARSPSTGERARSCPLNCLPPCPPLLPLSTAQVIKGDLQSGDLLSYVLTTEQIDTVIHMAAQTHVDNSFGNSLAFTMSNT